MTGINKQRPLTDLRGIGAKKAALFHKLGIDTVEDLLRDYPRAYDTYTVPVTLGELKPDSTAAVYIRLARSADVLRFGRMPVTRVSVQEPDSGQSLTAIWYNAVWMAASLKAGRRLVFRGRVVWKKKQLTMEQPEVFSPEEYSVRQGLMLPVYGQTKGLGNTAIVQAVKQVLAEMEEREEFLPEELMRELSLDSSSWALTHIHFPESEDKLRRARRRLVFEEFFFFVLAAGFLRDQKEKQDSSFRISGHEASDRLLAHLPYTLTDAQRRVWREIRSDLASGRVMKRLVQGDVGSGKTVIAALALFDTAAAGYQCAMMAPTEVLARQHADSLRELAHLAGLDVQIFLLTGSMSAARKREVYAAMESGRAGILVGTHALIQKKAVYRRLGLVITDEQHRFGVAQREMLENKGSLPHVLVMSATPIPRTLAVILYGDLDSSVIDSLPARRLPIRNAVVGKEYRERAYRFIEKEVAAGHQAYLICPMVEAGEMLELENVTDTAAMLQKRWINSGIRVAALHGQMKPDEKNAIMEAFARGEIQVLVSTTVIEVGINVPNATVMMIENAERFGLAQLHQLRGRVGRGDAQSYCILVNASGEEKASARLNILRDSDDGFFIASEDLRLRGPGDIFGLRQSGDLGFRLGDIYTDADLLRDASGAAKRILEKDPDLAQPQHRALHARLQEDLADKQKEINL